MTEQIYEDYRSLTLAFTDFNGKNFLATLKICLEFIDKYKELPYSEEKYKNLQKEIEAVLQINLISVRKAINQLVKMGFINSFLTWYNYDSLEYLNAKTNRKRESLLSKIIYSNSSFNRAVNSDSDLHQINFLIKTLIENWVLNKNEIIALMLVDIENIEKGYLNRDELQEYVEKAEQIGFTKRKYNQISYLSNLLGKLDDIVFVHDVLYFKDDAKNIFGDELASERKIRDPYLHRIYKNQLMEESLSILDWTKCMLEKLSYPVLIASHIKPFIVSDQNEAYDANNGLLLSKNMDSLFDLWYITFEDNGNIIKSSHLTEDVVDYLWEFELDTIFINKKRKEYLSYHREHVFKR